MHNESNLAKRTGILLAFLLVFAFSFTHLQEYPQAITCGIPVISTEYFDYVKLSIDQILDGNDNIYVLLDEHRGIVQVFDLSGEFQYTASFYDHMNGAFSIAVYKGDLYVRDSVHNIYILRDGKLFDFFEREAIPEWIRQIDFNASSVNYQERLGSIWCVSDEQEYCVVQRPLQAAFYQNNLYFMCAIIVVLIMAVRLRWHAGKADQR